MGAAFFSNCYSNHLKQYLAEEVLNRNLLSVNKKHLTSRLLSCLTSECWRVPELSPLTTSLFYFNSPWVIVFIPMLRIVCFIYHLFVFCPFLFLRPLVSELQIHLSFWVVCWLDISNLTCWKLIMCYFPQIHSFPSFLCLRKWPLLSW